STCASGPAARHPPRSRGGTPRGGSRSASPTPPHLPEGTHRGGLRFRFPQTPPFARGQSPGGDPVSASPKPPHLPEGSHRGGPRFRFPQTYLIGGPLRLPPNPLIRVVPCHRRRVRRFVAAGRRAGARDGRRTAIASTSTLSPGRTSRLTTTSVFGG